MDMLKITANIRSCALVLYFFPFPDVDVFFTLHHEALRVSRPGGDFSYYLCPGSSKR